MFLSIIIPVYNTDKYIAECLESCLKQDIADTEYEIICVNDGSTDSSGDILESYSRKYSNITVINQENAGVAVARNMGLEAAKGDYIWFVDSDDIICPDILGKLKCLTEDTPYDRVLLEAYVFGEKLTPEESERLNKHLLNSNSWTYNTHACCNILRSAYLKENGLCFKYREITHGEDCIFMYEFGICKPTEIMGPKEPAYLYRTRPSSAMTSSGNQAEHKKHRSYYAAAKIIKSYYNSKVGDLNWCANLLMHFIWYDLLSLSSMPLNEALQGLKELHKAGLFPYKKPRECTVKKSYCTTRTDFVGKLYDCIHTHMNRVWGFLLMRAWHRAYRVKERIRG